MLIGGQVRFKDRTEMKALCGMLYSLETERQLLGSLLLDNQCWGKVAGKVFASDFYIKVHGRIFEYITDFAGKNLPFDQFDMTQALVHSDEPLNRGEVSRIDGVTEGIPSEVNIESHASTVRQYSINRQLVNVCCDLVDSTVTSKGQCSSTLLEGIEKDVLKIIGQGVRSTKALEPIKDFLRCEVDIAAGQSIPKKMLTRVNTGFNNLDKVLEIKPTDLMVVAGRSLMGSTSFVMSLVEKVGVQDGFPVAVFSMAKHADDLVMQMVSSLGKINHRKVGRGVCVGELDEDEQFDMQVAINLLEESKIFIDDTSVLTSRQIRERSFLQTMEQGQLGLIVVDCLEVVEPAFRNESRAEAVSGITRSLKRLARQLHVPIVLLSQLSEGLEKREDKRPVISDLIESDSIEPNADVITFVYRDEVYNRDTAEKGVAEIIIGKQGNGKLGSCKLAFIEEFYRFENNA